MATGKHGEGLVLQFCALEHRPQNLTIGASPSAPVILLVLRDEGGSLHFLVHPEFRTLVPPEQLDYFETLLRDFAERAKVDPEALFKQLSSLGVGPLVTKEAGSDLSEYPDLQKLSEQFVRL